MTKRKATIILEGNSRKQERFVHELKKAVSEADQEPELTATIQVSQVLETEHDEPHFTNGDSQP